MKILQFTTLFYSKIFACSLALEMLFLCVKSMLQIYRKIVKKSAFGADFTLFYSFCENKFHIMQNALYIKSFKAKFITIIYVKTHCICRCGFNLLHQTRHVDIPYIFYILYFQQNFFLLFATYNLIKKLCQ